MKNHFKQFTALSAGILLSIIPPANAAAPVLIEPSQPYVVVWPSSNPSQQPITPTKPVLATIPSSTPKDSAFSGFDYEGPHYGDPAHHDHTGRRSRR